MDKHNEPLTEKDLQAFDEAAKGYWFDDESEVITAKGFWRRAKHFYRDNPRMLTGENLPQGSITSVSAEIEKLSKLLGIEIDEKSRQTLVLLWPLILDHKTKQAEDKTEASMETLFRVANFLEIDFEKAREESGKPSDVYIRHIHQFAEKAMSNATVQAYEKKHYDELGKAAELGKIAYEQVQAYRQKKNSPWSKLKRACGLAR